MALYIACCCCCCSFFFFKQKTAYEMRISDWSSDVCSSDLPTLVRLGMERGPEGWRAGGLFLQHLPEGEEGRERLHTRLDHPEWEHVVALAQTMGVDELADAGMPLETLVWRLFNEEDEVRVLASTPLVRGCRCSPDYIAQVLAKLPPGETREKAAQK